MVGGFAASYDRPSQLNFGVRRCTDTELNRPRERENSMTPLSQAERDRLDPRVNIDRLEAFLAQVPINLRALALNSFYAEPDADSMTIIGVTDPAVERLWLLAWGGAEDGGGPPPA